MVKVFRLFRLVRVAMLLREHGAARLRGSLLRNRAGSALLSLLLLGILVLQFGSLWVLALEQGAPDATITSAPDTACANAVYFPSSRMVPSRESAMNTCEPFVSGSAARAMLSTPKSCPRPDFSRSRLYPGPPSPVPVGSPTCTTNALPSFRSATTR